MSEINNLHNIISNKLYGGLLKDYEDSIVLVVNKYEDYKIVDGLLGVIIKIKTIQAMDISKELIAESRRISRN